MAPAGSRCPREKRWTSTWSVLVYGLRRGTIEALVAEGLAAAALDADVDVSTTGDCATHDDVH